MTKTTGTTKTNSDVKHINTPSTKVVANVDSEGKKTLRRPDPKKAASIKKTGGGIGVWENKTLDIVKNVKVIIPIKILYVMREIEIKLNKNVEFGLYLKGEFKDNTLLISEDYMIPDQKVSSASIQFNEDGESGSNCEWNGVIHKHPSGCKSFSGTDEEYINANHLFSLLYVDNQISKGVMNLTFKEVEGRCQLPLTISFRYPSMGIQSDDIEKIHTFQAPTTVVKSYGHGHYQYQYPQSYGKHGVGFHNPAANKPAATQHQSQSIYRDNEHFWKSVFEDDDDDYNEGTNSEDRLFTDEEFDDYVKANMSELKQIFGENFDKEEVRDEFEALASYGLLPETD